MVLGDHVVGHLDIGNKDVAVLHVDSELLLDRLVHMDRSLDVDESSLVSPVRIEGDGHALSEGRVTFQRSGSTLLSLSWTHLMMRLAVRPGWVGGGLRGDGSRCVWEGECRRSGEQW